MRLPKWVSVALLLVLAAAQRSPAQQPDGGAAAPDGAGPKSCFGCRLFPNRPRPIQNRIESSPNHGCFAHHNLIGCGSLPSECTFIFGSCRTFFGLPCLKEPPPGFNIGPVYAQPRQPIPQ